MAKPLNLIGQRFGRLTVTDRIGMNDNRLVMWQCRCDCGREVPVSTRDLRSRGVVSCGCNRLEKSRTNLNSVPQSVKLGQIGGTNLSRLSSGKPPRNSSSGVRGVSPLPNGTYRAYVYFRRKRYDAGIYKNLDEAKAAVESLRRSIIQDTASDPDMAAWRARQKNKGG